MIRQLFCITVVLSLASLVSADVRLPTLFSDHMVVQRDKAIKVWGWANPGEKVTVSLSGNKTQTTADAKGEWKAELPAMKAGGPHEMIVAGQNTVKITDVLVGEVWLCSGQSNMEFGLKHARDAQQEIKGADYPQIRLLHVPRTPSALPLNDVKARWFVCSPTNTELGDFSAVGYFFGREIHKKLNVPVGMITAAQGATQIEIWTPTAGKPELYNGMIYPLIPFAIRGALWYQGESNCGDGMRYVDKMKALVGGWRNVWQEGEFPFYFVQITPNRYNGALPFLLEAQHVSMTIPNTGMAQSTDTCDPSDNYGGGHPRNKQEIGRRLALWALAKDYGQKDLVYSGPICTGVRAEGSKLRVSFAHVGTGLVTKDGKDPDFFEVAGADGTFADATAKIDGVTVVIGSDKVPQPTALRFAWKDLAQPNLMNKEGLPVSTFRFDVLKVK